MDVEKEAREAALKQVAALFQRPDQLERIGELKKRSERKKAAVEAMLRTGVQSQMEGIRNAIALLRTASEDVVAVDNETENIRIRLAPFPQLQERMRELRECSVRHDQYAAAIENLRLIVNMQELVAEAKKALGDNKQLIAHKNIMDLERARDELMYEVHKLNGQTTEKDKKLLLMFFKDVDDLVHELWSQMRMNFKRCLDMVKGSDPGEGPQYLVSSLRIVEREERIDRYYIERRAAMNDFMPPGRPRRWKYAALEAIDVNVQQRVEGNQIEHDRTANVAWLARYLETCRVVILEDLKLAKIASTQCFPPEYEMHARFIDFYHKAIQKKLGELSHEGGLNKGEIVQLLRWVREYTGEGMLGSPQFGINATAMVADDPLLSYDVQIELRERFLKSCKDDLGGWLVRTVNQEKAEWFKDMVPEMDSDGTYYTALPSILFRMVEDQMNLAKEFNVDLIPHVIDISVVEMQPSVALFKEAIMSFKAENHLDRGKFEHYTKTMVANANNMQLCAIQTEKYLRQIRLSMEEETTQGLSRSILRKSDAIEHITRLIDTWNNAKEYIAINILLHELYEDISKHLVEVFTRKWLDGYNQPMGYVVETIIDYLSDHSHLRSSILLYMATKIQYKVIGEYLKGMEEGRLTLASVSERKKAVQELKNDAKRIETCFNRYVPSVEESQFTPLHSILHSFADVLDLNDKSLISLEAANFARKYPNCRLEVLSALLLLREDIGRVEARQLATECLAHTAHHPKDPSFGELFELSRLDASTWSTPLGDVQMATSKLATILRRGVGADGS